MYRLALEIAIVEDMLSDHAQASIKKRSQFL
jgi:hypothetical protein